MPSPPTGRRKVDSRPREVVERERIATLEARLHEAQESVAEMLRRLAEIQEENERLPSQLREMKMAYWEVWQKREQAERQLAEAREALRLISEYAHPDNAGSYRAYLAQCGSIARAALSPATSSELDSSAADEEAGMRRHVEPVGERQGRQNGSDSPPVSVPRLGFSQSSESEPSATGCPSGSDSSCYCGETSSRNCPQHGNVEHNCEVCEIAAELADERSYTGKLEARLREAEHQLAHSEQGLVCGFRDEVVELQASLREAQEKIGELARTGVFFRRERDEAQEENERLQRAVDAEFSHIRALDEIQIRETARRLAIYDDARRGTPGRLANLEAVVEAARKLRDYEAAPDDDCPNCSWDSGPYDVPCDEHDYLSQLGFVLAALDKEPGQ